MRYSSSHNGFTLIEMMLVVAMIGIVAAAVFYMGGPYINRSRDLARFTDLSHYDRVVDLYYKDHDMLPSNDASVGAFGYCAEEVFFERPSIAQKEDQQFVDLRELLFNKPMRDPLKLTLPIGPCTRSGSYLYSSFTAIEDGNKYSLLGARMSVLTNGNYLTGSDIGSDGIVSLANLQNMKASYKGTISDTTLGSSYYFMVTQH